MSIEYLDLAKDWMEDDDAGRGFADKPVTC